MLVMMSFGRFSFRLPSVVYQQLAHKRGIRIAVNERVGTVDAFQFVGPGPERITLSGVTAAGINRATVSFDRLNTILQDARELPLVDGLGNVYGQFLLVTFDIDRENFTALGQARRSEFTLELERVDDPTVPRSPSRALRLARLEQLIGDPLSVFSLPNGPALPGIGG